MDDTGSAALLYQKFKRLIKFDTRMAPQLSLGGCSFSSISVSGQCVYSCTGRSGECSGGMWPHPAANRINDIPIWFIELWGGHGRRRSRHSLSRHRSARGSGSLRSDASLETYPSPPGSHHMCGTTMKRGGIREEANPKPRRSGLAPSRHSRNRELAQATEPTSMYSAKAEP